MYFVFESLSSRIPTSEVDKNKLSYDEEGLSEGNKCDGSRGQSSNSIFTATGDATIAKRVMQRSHYSSYRADLLLPFVVPHV